MLPHFLGELCQIRTLHSTDLVEQNIAQGRFRGVAHYLLSIAKSQRTRIGFVFEAVKYNRASLRSGYSVKVLIVS